MARAFAFTEAIDRAKLYGHQPTGFRSEEKKAAAICVRCGASLYVDSSKDPPIIDGTAFDGECPDAC